MAYAFGLDGMANDSREPLYYHWHGHEKSRDRQAVYQHINECTLQAVVG